ncbi:hypothetical protein HK101_003341 [Irineochytrium annulatum]|nr:hypothetical protein HK101_003341 [Irineochytrium annulatum]
MASLLENKKKNASQASLEIEKEKGGSLSRSSMNNSVSSLASGYGTDDVQATANVDMADGTSKISFVWGLLRKLAGVKDIASMRLSLPANLMEPRSNLEFWNYNDRPDIFATISEPEDPVERMLRVVTWFFGKDSKWTSNQLRKPYNPVLGEAFICNWEVNRESLDDASVKTKDGPMKVTGINEQILHHPAISAFYYECEETGVVARGVDHVAAKFTGTAIKVGAGEYNHGVYINLEKRGHEEYNMTYPWASINGWITGKPFICVSETSVTVCPKTKLKCVVLYKDEPFFGSPKFAVEGKVFRYDPEADAKMTDKERKHAERLDKIPEADVVATIRGAWNGQIYTTVKGAEEKLLIDMAMSETAEKIVRPIEEQEEYESRRLWKDVTEAIHAKNFQEATTLKRAIEQHQRQIRAERQEPYVSKFFEFKYPVGPANADEDPMERGKPYLKAMNQESVLVAIINSQKPLHDIVANLLSWCREALESRDFQGSLCNFMPSLCAFLFGSGDPGGSYLTGVIRRCLTDRERHAILDLLSPESAFLRLIMLLAGDRSLIYEIVSDRLPIPTQKALGNLDYTRLPRLYTNKLEMNGHKVDSRAATPSPHPADGSPSKRGGPFRTSSNTEHQRQVSPKVMFSTSIALSAQLLTA